MAADSGLPPGQLGRIFENLVENAYTARAGGRMLSYVPVLDSHAVDRAVSVDGGAPLFLQIKGHLHAHQGRYIFAIPVSAVGDYERWYAVCVAGDATGLQAAFVVGGRDAIAMGGHGHLVDGRPCVRLVFGRRSRYFVHPDRLADRLLELAGAAVAPEAVGPPLERQQEEGAYFEAAVSAALFGTSDRLALYRPAVDLAGRDFLVQLAGTPRYLYIQVKGSVRTEAGDHVRFQVRRRTLAADPSVAYLFAYRDADGLGPVWLVDAPELLQRSAAGDPEHVSFEARLGGDDRWSDRRLTPSELAGEVLARLSC
jgi:hypothetical protein